MTQNKYDTIVVGGGIAGLTATAYLARAGQRVLLIEKNAEFGGLVSTFVRDGFRFEAGLRAIENAGVIFPMLEQLGIELEVVKSHVSVGVGKRIVDIYDFQSIEDYRNMLVKEFPDSEAEINDFITVMKRVMKHLDVLYGIENPAFKDLKKDTRYIFRKLLPWLPKFMLTVGKINKMSMPIEGYLATIIKNQACRDIISQHFFKGTPAFFALSYFSLYLDYVYPIGGVGKLADALSEKILEWGGELKSETLINRVDAKNQVVFAKDETTYEYDQLVWAGDLKTFYNITETQGLPEKIQSQFQDSAKNMAKSKGSESVFALYLEVDLPASYFEKIAKGHFFYTPSKTGLAETHRADLKLLLDEWDNVGRKELHEWMIKFLELNTFEISIPVLKDKSAAPANKSGVIISFLTEFEMFEKILERGWYDEFRERMEEKVIDVLSDSIYPALKQNIEKKFSFTPMSFKSRIATSEGAIVGWSFENEIPVKHKIQDSGKSVQTPIPNIFQAGQWSYSPAGVPMSVLTGKIAADNVLKSQ
ncbi:MAG: NAD(P)/FAD-dependent oxidoreductase [Cyclobacteriaceae bacterium]